MPRESDYVAKLVFEAICEDIWYVPDSEGSASLATGRTLWYRNGLILSQPNGELRDIVIAHYSESAVWLLDAPGSAHIRRSGGWLEAPLVPESQHTLFSALLGKSPIARVLFTDDQELGTFITNSFSSSDGSLTGFFEGERSGGLATAIALLILELEDREEQARKAAEEQARSERERELARQETERRARVEQARAAGKDVCGRCETIEPDRCCDCGTACLHCDGYASDLCWSCWQDRYNDDDD